MSTTPVSISILGKSYKVASPEDQIEALQETAADLDQRLSQLQAKSPKASTEQLFLMVALNLCHDLRQEALQKQEYARTIDLRIEALQQSIESALLKQADKLDLNQVESTNTVTAADAEETRQEF